MALSRFLRIALIAAATLSAAGCGSTPDSSYLGDTSRFKPDAKLGNALSDRHPTRSPRDFKKVWLDNMEVLFANSAEAREVDAASLKEFIAFWRSETESHLKASHELATGPGEGTLKLRMALTHVHPAKSGQMITPITSPTRVDLATATLEAEAVDSVSGERILAVIDRNAGHRAAGEDRLSYSKKTIKAWMDRLFASSQSAAPAPAKSK